MSPLLQECQVSELVKWSTTIEQLFFMSYVELHHLDQEEIAISLLRCLDIKNISKNSLVDILKQRCKGIFSL